MYPEREIFDDGSRVQTHHHFHGRRTVRAASERRIVTALGAINALIEDK